MGGKKRPSSSMDEEPVADASSGKVSDKLRQMEKRKARKALDKERRRSALQGKQQQQHQPEEKKELVAEAEAEAEAEGESVPVEKESAPAAVSVNVASTSLGQPGLHLDLFRGLSAQESGVREEAAERLVRELRDVQRSYEESNGGGGEEAAEAVKMEAKKDDGMDNCAPSLRYAIRRFVRGVSSSREVRNE